MGRRTRSEGRETPRRRGERRVDPARREDGAPQGRHDDPLHESRRRRVTVSRRERRTPGLVEAPGPTGQLGRGPTGAHILSVGELGRASRGLFGVGWSFRRLTVEDLEASARGGAFWEIGAGWALASAGPDARFDVGWIETRPEDITDLLRSLVDLAIGTGSELITLWIPDVDWAVQAARRLGFDTSVMYIYASPL